MEASVAWDAVSAVAAAIAVIVSAVVWWTQHQRDKQQADMQQRLTAIEEARREDEVAAREQAREAARIADLRIAEFRMEQPGNAGNSDKVSLTFENRGPAPARNIAVALLEADERAGSSGLGDAVERAGEGAGYYLVPSVLPDVLGPGEQVRVSFWLRYRTIGNGRFRLAWEDERGPQVARPQIDFDPDPAWRN